MDKVRIGIIGCGNMGSGYVRMITGGDCPDAVITAVADRKAERRKWAASMLPSAAVFSDGLELIESGECDAVMIETPHYQHPELAIAAMRHGLHVLSDKPAGVYTKQVREMNEEAGKHPELVFAIMFNQRTNPVYIRMKEIVSSGSYGAIKRVNWIVTDWYRTQIYYDSGAWRATWAGEGGGVLLNQCPHQMDLVTWICGMPSRVRAFCRIGAWHDIEVEDDISAYWEYPNGATGVFVTSTGDAPGTNRLEIDLEKAKLVAENGKLSVYALDVSEREFCRTAKGGFDSPPGHFIEAGIEGDYPEHKGVINAFTSAILGKGNLIAPGEEGINGLTLSNAIYLSSWLDRTVDIPFDEDLFLSELEKRISTSKAKEERSITFSTEGSYGGASHV